MLINLRIQVFLDNMESSRSVGRKAAPDLHISNIMLHCWEEDLFLEFSVGFPPKMVVLIIGLICPENGLPRSPWFVQMLFGKVETGIVFFLEHRYPSSNPPINVMSVQFSSDCRRMYIYPRCCQRGMQLSRGHVWVGLYLIYYFSGDS